jgi:hypothetical protein
VVECAEEGHLSKMSIVEGRDTMEDKDVEGVTPRVTNHQGSVMHMLANTTKFKTTRYPTGKIEKIELCHCGPDGPIHKF